MEISSETCQINNLIILPSSLKEEAQKQLQFDIDNVCELDPEKNYVASVENVSKGLKKDFENRQRRSVFMTSQRSRGRGLSKSKVVFQQRTSQISLVQATISGLKERGSSIPFPHLVQFTSGSKFNLLPQQMRILHIKIDLKIKLDIENIAKIINVPPYYKLSRPKPLENTIRKLQSQGRGFLDNADFNKFYFSGLQRPA